MLHVFHEYAAEPILTMGSTEFITWEDNWTILTADGGPSAQFEHTILITSTGADILTQSWFHVINLLQADLVTCNMGTYWFLVPFWHLYVRIVTFAEALAALVLFRNCIAFDVTINLLALDGWRVKGLGMIMILKKLDYSSAGFIQYLAQGYKKITKDVQEMSFYH